MIDLAIIHYHLLAGGVTNVIYLSVIALLRNSRDIGTVTLVCGSAENTDKLMEKFRSEIPEHVERIFFKIIPELSYMPENALSLPELRKKLLDALKNKIWLVHNYHLGKNPVFTKTVLEIAAGFPDQRIIFYIHDFPECARYHNLEFLLKYSKGPFYPVRQNVRYLVINDRDRSLLVKAGIPEQYVFLVHNPVEDCIPSVDIKRINLCEKLTAFNDLNQGRLCPDRPVFLYPVRMIRRKNILEACLLCRAAGSEPNLIVTLPGLSGPEKPYSQLIEKVFSRFLVNGLCSIGMHLDKIGINYVTLFRNADLILSSSVQEGFGYLFIDSIQHRVPLFARHLDIISDFENIFPDESTAFYKHISIPCSNKEISVLQKAYYSKINTLKAFLPPFLINSLRDQINTFSAKNVIDFSLFPAPTQYDILERVSSSPDFRNEIITMNQPLLNDLDRVSLSKVPEVEIESVFGYKRYTKKLFNIFQSFTDQPSSPKTSNDSSVQKNLLGSFAKLDYLRLIYDDLA
ncbi:MAG: hypothetical protein JW874_13380 [Spirochaetales bacterium]|nr:hypothetical protein [Spirochaetales bacterium]